MWRHFAIAGLLLATVPSEANDPIHWRSREVVYAYFDRPKTYATIRVTKRAVVTQVEICADVCDAFTAQLPPDSSLLWDAILIFKAVVSRSEDDQRFGAEYRAEATDVLARMTRSGQCGGKTEIRARALCALSGLAKNAALEYAEIKYDEGNRCAVYRSLDAKERVLRSRCSKA